MHMHMSGYVHMAVSDCKGPKWVSALQGLELEAIGSHWTWMLGTEFYKSNIYS